MSIEGAAKAAGPKPVAAEHPGTKARGKPAGEDTSAQAGGFLALLTSLSPPVTPELAGEGPPELGDAQGLVVSAAPVAPQGLPSELALMLNQGGDGGPDPSVGVDGALVAKGRPGASRPALAVGLEKPELGLAASAAAGSEGVTGSTPEADPLLEQAAALLAIRTSKNGGALLQSGTLARAVESRALDQFALGEGPARDVARGQTLVGSALGEGFLRPTERSAKPPGAPGRSGIEGLWGQHALPGAARADTAPVLAGASLAGLESKVADTVNYWMAQGVQNAALKLDGLGSEPVEVNISLKGREAHIGFRTDQPEIRQILEGALSQLKDLLASEGLLLSGVSVGSSGQNGKGTPERRPPPSAQHARIAMQDVGLGEHNRGVSQTVGRAVDIFV